MSKNQKTPTTSLESQKRLEGPTTLFGIAKIGGAVYPVKTVVLDISELEVISQIDGINRSLDAAEFAMAEDALKRREGGEL